MYNITYILNVAHRSPVIVMTWPAKRMPATEHTLNKGHGHDLKPTELSDVGTNSI